jgi:hypothetical protein
MTANYCAVDMDQKRPDIEASMISGRRPSYVEEESLQQKKKQKSTARSYSLLSAGLTR